MEISIQTLAVCVQAVDEKIRELEEQIAASDDPELSCLEDELLVNSKPEMELKKLYIEAQKRTSNFPPYDELLK